MWSSGSYHRLRNGSIICDIVPTGAALGRLFLSGGCGGFDNVLLALADTAQYGRDASYSGATLGPCAGRLSGASMAIGGHICRMRANDGPNLLHGGEHGLSHQRFTCGAHIRAEGTESVTLRAVLPDGLDGWPGNRRIAIRYTLGPGPCLTINYRAATDKPTYLDLSTHAYWNLSGVFSSSALSQKIQIRASRVLYNDARHLPVRAASVTGTPFDFLHPTALADAIARFPQDAQLKNARGYNNAFLLDDGAGPAVRLWDAAGTRRMDLFTDHPSVVLYSGGYLGRDTLLEDGKSAVPGCALALEPQNWPDAPHLPGAPSGILLPGETYSRFVRFCFSPADLQGSVP